MFALIHMVATQLLEKTVERIWKQFKLNLWLSNEDERKYSGIRHADGFPREDEQGTLIFHPPCKLQHPNQMRKLWKRRAKKNNVETYFIPLLSYSWTRVNLKAFLLIVASLPALQQHSELFYFLFFLSPAAPSSKQTWSSSTACGWISACASRRWMQSRSGVIVGRQKVKVTKPRRVWAISAPQHVNLAA